MELRAGMLSPDGTVLLTAYYVGGGVQPPNPRSLLLWDVDRGSVRWARYSMGWDGARAPTLLADGKRALVKVSAAYGGRGKPPAKATLQVIDLTNGDTLRAYDLNVIDVDRIAAGPDTNFVLFGNEDLFGNHASSISYFDVAKGRVTRTLRTGHVGIDNLIVSGDGRYALSDSAANSADRGAVLLWAVGPGKVLHEFKYADGWAGIPMAFSPDGKYAVLPRRDAGGDYLVTVAIPRGQVRYRLSHDSPVAISFTPDGQGLLTFAHHKKTLRIRDLATGREVWSLPVNAPLRACGFSADGRRAWADGNDEPLVWDTVHGRLLRAFPPRAVP